MWCDKCWGMVSVPTGWDCATDSHPYTVPLLQSLCMLELLCLQCCTFACWWKQFVARIGNKLYSVPPYYVQPSLHSTFSRNYTCMLALLCWMVDWGRGSDVMAGVTLLLCFGTLRENMTGHWCFLVLQRITSASFRNTCLIRCVLRVCSSNYERAKCKQVLLHKFVIIGKPFIRGLVPSSSPSDQKECIDLLSVHRIHAQDYAV